MIMHLKCTVIPLINASSPCTLHWMFHSVLTEETCRVHVLLWACSSFMNINEDTRRPTELIKTLDHYCRPTVGILRFRGASSWKPGESAMLGSHQSSFEINLEIIDTKARCWTLQCDISASRFLPTSQLEISSWDRFCWLVISTLLHRSAPVSQLLLCALQTHYHIIMIQGKTHQSSTLNPHYPSDKDSNVLWPSLGWSGPEGLSLTKTFGTNCFVNKNTNIPYKGWSPVKRGVRTDPRHELGTLWGLSSPVSVVLSAMCNRWTPEILWASPPAWIKMEGLSLPLSHRLIRAVHQPDWHIK